MTDDQRIRTVRRIIANRSNGFTLVDACERNHIPVQTYYTWKRKFFNSDDTLKNASRENDAILRPIISESDIPGIEIERLQNKIKSLESQLEDYKEALTERAEETQKLKDMLYDIMTGKFEPRTDDIRGIVARSVLEEWTKIKKSD